jgi:hypothetical protein
MNTRGQRMIAVLVEANAATFELCSRIGFAVRAIEPVVVPTRDMDLQPWASPRKVTEQLAELQRRVIRLLAR